MYVRACACVCGVSVGTLARAFACERVALLIQHATRRHIANCGFPGSTIFFDIISKSHVLFSAVRGGWNESEE